MTFSTILDSSAFEKELLSHPQHPQRSIYAPVCLVAYQAEQLNTAKRLPGNHADGGPVAHAPVKLSDVSLRARTGVLERMVRFNVRKGSGIGMF